MAVAAAAVAVQGSHAPSRLRIALVAAVTTAAVMVGVSGWRP
jgi:hypothetical protein